MNGKIIKVKYVSPKPHGDFERGKIYEAQRSTQIAKMLIIRDKYGEEFGYPASDFEIVEE